jgi:hypothetical protein
MDIEPRDVGSPSSLTDFQVICTNYWYGAMTEYWENCWVLILAVLEPIFIVADQEVTRRNSELARKKGCEREQGSVRGI